MRLRLLPIFFLATAPVGAATLRGVILLNERGGPPIANVQVSAAEGVNAVSTQSNGAFLLEFPDKQPGESVQLIVHKPGMVVVNDIQLEVALPKNARAATLFLLLSKPAEREEMARRFYRLKSLEAIEQSYEKKLRELEARNRMAEEATEERRKRDLAREASVRVADELARGIVGETSKLFRRAMSFFLDGNIDEALSTLEEKKLAQSAALAVEQKAAAEKEIQQLVEAYLLKGQLFTTKLQFVEAQNTFETAVGLAPDSAQASFNLAVFHHGMGQFSEAARAYERTLAITRRENNGEATALTLNNLGQVLTVMLRVDEAQKVLEEAHAIYQKVSSEHDGADVAEMAMTLSNLGLLYGAQNRFSEARKYLGDALAIRRRLADASPAAYLPELARNLNNLGATNSDDNWLEEARRNYGEAVEIFRRLATENPTAYRPDLAMTLNNIGLLDYDTNRRKEAGKAYQEALAIYRALVRETPVLYLPSLAMTLNNLGMLLADENRRGEAREAFNEALLIRRKLSTTDPIVYSPALALTLMNLGVLMSREQNYEEARAFYHEAMVIRRRQVETNPEVFLPDLALMLQNLGTLNRDTGRFEDSRENLDEALEIRRNLAKGNDGFRRYVAQTLNSLGLLLLRQDRAIEGQLVFDEAIAIFRELAQHDPTVFQPKLAETLVSLGILHQRQNSRDHARKAYAEALKIYEGLAATNPGLYAQNVQSVASFLNELPYEP